jgi:hypothetical protein
MKMLPPDPDQEPQPKGGCLLVLAIILTILVGGHAIISALIQHFSRR